LRRAEEAVSRLLRHYGRRTAFKRLDAFRSLVRTILSQNTNYKNEAMAFQRLEESIGITPEGLSGSTVEAIADAIRPAGMYNQRGRTLRLVAQAVMDRYEGEISPLLDLPYAEAREALMSLPGVGPKTADVLLMFNAGKQIVPVDRHIFRISKRLEIVEQRAGYDEVRLALEAATPPGRHEDVHVLLIRFGRAFCRARNPRCPECFLRDTCPYPEEGAS
jgi:endonuclease-3